MSIKKTLRASLTFSFIIGAFAAIYNLSPTSVVDAQSSCTQTVTNTNNDGSGSLRQAIRSANVNANLDVICFSIGSGLQTITPTSGMDAITRPAKIDGTTQPGYNGSPLIEINGQNVPTSGTPGLWITGGDSVVRGLVINRSRGNGIMITDGGNNVIAGNYIGVNSAGTSALGNGIDGIGMITANNTIGGTSASDRNIISGNNANGIGITNQAAKQNTIIGNYVGTDKNGTYALANGGDAVLINNSITNKIGGTQGTTPNSSCSGSCNLLSGNAYNGVGLFNANENSIVGNYVGVSASGTVKLPNKDIGIELQESANNTVGNSTTNGRNVISANGGAGILITGGASIGNTVGGNLIGLDATGINPLGNSLMGISVGNSPGLNNSYARNNTIGGTTDPTTKSCSGACNAISGNVQNGIIISGGSGAGNTVLGNYVGVRVDGTGDKYGAVRNGLDGIGILNSPNNTIGNNAPSGRNIISGNTNNGVIIAGNGSTGNRIQGNYIGRSLDTRSDMIRIGNGGIGVAMSSGVSTAIIGNSITSNDKLGIDIGYNDITLNDPGDGDGGVNNQQNYPEIFSAINTSDETTKISGIFNGNANNQFQLDFFTSAGCNAGKPKNYGEGDTYVGSTSVGTDQFGNISFTFTSDVQLPGNSYVTATATRKINGVPAETSEFSKCVLVNASKPLVTNGADWYLKDDLTDGSSDRSFQYGFPPNTLFCAWDPAKPGTKLPVVVSATGTWYFRASYTTGVADKTVQFGFNGGTPVCGDWDGDGIDTVGMVSGSLTWFLRNSNTSGSADMSFQYGPAGTPVVGDWDGDGKDGVGVFTPDSRWSLRNQLSGGGADAYFQYGGAGVLPVVGDWDGNRADSIGTYTPSTGGWSLRSINSSGPATTSYNYGFTGTKAQTW